jgi:hypothetical protein
MAKVIGFVGLIGSGKDTAADYLVNFHEFRRDSFAGTLKDAVAHVFSWDRELLEGRTKQAREWREQVDPWWSERLGLPNLTPRWVLQYWGTEVCRHSFHDDIWIASLENKMRKTSDNIVISDVRFPNEITAINNAGGIVVRVKRGPDPEWFDVATESNLSGYNHMKNAFPEVHASEYSWAGSEFAHEIENNGTIQDLYDSLEQLLSPVPA